MARHALRWARRTKTNITKKCPYGHRKHDPAIVSHEEKPANRKHVYQQGHTCSGV